MARISHYLTLATGAAVLLVQPVLAQADPVHSRHAAYRHYTAYRYHYGAAYADGYLSVPEILNEVATSPSYGTFGGYEDTFWASHYLGPVERRYFGYGWDPALRY